jgi:lysophospholipase L1-like esterase
VLSFILLTSLLAAAFLVLLVSLALSLSRNRIELPADNPARLLAMRAEAAQGATAGERRPPLAVCAGDSITHGVVSANYVDMLKARMPDWEFSNAGVNSELAFNLAARLDDIIALDPQAVTILIGTNDANATFGLRSALGYYALHRLPERPSALFYRENLTLIVRRLKKETNARIGLLSIPPIGEDPGHYAWIRTEEYASVIKEVARAEGVDYLPLRERICAYLESVPKADAISFQRFNQAQYRAVRQRLLLGKSFDEISASNGFHLLVDGLHLNTHAAAMAADLVEGFLRSKGKA